MPSILRVDPVWRLPATSASLMDNNSFAPMKFRIPMSHSWVPVQAFHARMEIDP